MSLLAADRLSRRFGGLTALTELSFAIESGTIHAIIGPNGAGKTTLLNLVTGFYRPSSGRVRFAGADVTGLPPHRLAALGLARTFQNLQIFLDMSAAENVLVGAHRHSDRRLAASFLQLPSLRRAEAALRAKAAGLLAAVGLAGAGDRIAGELPYGALKRLELARALAAEPLLLLLDEPAAGLNERETGEMKALIRALPARGITVALVEHDMRLVMEVSDRILVLDHGSRLAEGTPEEIRRDPGVIASYLGAGARRERTGAARD
jgi:branched-chain amino acid transport system ATP-binding protein